ncbi:vegetative incompatibility protein het-e-like protein [Diplodia corticola]|uniref:protein-ribulosamine 3-kinase n=1 Tax=Diplodia corticola TaxID=236234 RepID=A0A1J9RW52_9PEZI|nr:vegetative incompatibility protein het-e-like protein [Diplodia corticola]OJD32068.1 vegetative incompatibility protein het-e-like protein [Diplodia corticola]
MSATAPELLHRAPPDHPLPPPIGFPIDAEAILAKFPAGTKLLSATPSGTSAWTTTACLHVEFPSGSTQRYFLKCASGDDDDGDDGAGGRALIEGEYHAMSALYAAAPDFVPAPHSWGEFSSSSTTTKSTTTTNKSTTTPTTYYFLLTQFIPLQPNPHLLPPDPDQLCAQLSSLHRTSASPTGQFGFHATTCQGRTAQAVRGWHASWAACFGEMLAHAVRLDAAANGRWEGLERVWRRVEGMVVPRLVGAVEREARGARGGIRPCLVHGDLWEGNVGTAVGGGVYVFDGASLYAHHEMEVGGWRCAYNKIHAEVYTRTYLRYMGPSEPVEEWDDRNRIAYEDMYYLVDKYAPFPHGEGPPRLSADERVSLSAERDHTVA